MQRRRIISAFGADMVGGGGPVSVTVTNVDFGLSQITTSGPNIPSGVSQFKITSGPNTGLIGAAFFISSHVFQVTDPSPFTNGITVTLT